MDLTPGTTKFVHCKVSDLPAHPSLKQGWSHETKIIKSFFGHCKLYTTEIDHRNIKKEKLEIRDFRHDHFTVVSKGLVCVTIWFVRWRKVDCLART